MTAPQELHEALTLWLERDPQAPALRGLRGPWLSRGDLMRRLEAGQQLLRRAGLSPSDRVALLMPQGLEGAIVSLQVARACTLAPLRPGLPSRHWPELLSRLAPAALVLSTERAPVIAAAAQALGIALIEPHELLKAPEPTAPASSQAAAAAMAPARADASGAEDRSESCLVIATSGTTGLPKWVNLSQASVLRGCQAMARTLELDPSDRTLLALPLHHTHGLVSGLVMPLITGGSVVVTEGFEADETIRLIGEQAITWITLPPAMHLALLEAHSRTPLASGHRLRFLRSGAVSLPVPQIERLQSAFGVPVIEAYGMSECPHISSNPLAAPRAGTVGKPVVEELAITDSEGRPLSPGQWGQVMVRGAPVMRGYLHTDSSAGTAFVDGWLPTGDEGMIDADGYLLLRGRLQERINRGGLKVAPTVVDAALLSHDDVREALTFAIPHPTLGEDVAAVVVPRAGAKFDEQKLRRHALRRLAPHEVPSTILQLGRIPHGSTGKPSRRGMAERLAPLLQAEGDPARRGLEGVVASTFAAVLERPLAGRDANFFRLGGDSLSGMRVMLQLERQLGQALEPTLLFRHPTAACLARELRRSMAVPGPEDSPPHAGQPQAHPIPAAPALPGDWPAGCLAFPASDAQVRLWFLHQLRPDLCAYHLPAMWRLRGRLDHASLDRALTALIERHSSLRSSFQPLGNAIVQIIHPPAPFRLQAESLAGRESRWVIENWLEQERSTPFDLTSGLLLRARLLQLDNDEHLLLLNQHHIASDGWSCTLLARDLTELYNACTTDRPHQLPPLALAYHDYAVWSQEHLSDTRLEPLRLYWTSQLSGLEALELPSDHPRPAQPSHRGGCVSFEIGSDLLSPWEELCRSQGATLQMGLLALVALLLHRYSRQNDFTIGVPIWGRNHPDLEPLIGCFVNTLPIRVRFGTQQSFRDLLQQVKAVSLAAYENQALPFEQMVDALQPEREISRNPLVQVIMQLIDFPATTRQSMHGINCQPLDLSSQIQACRFDLEFQFRHSDNNTLRGEILFATDLFRPDRIQRLKDHLITLLTSALQNPDSPADTLPLIPELELKLIRSWQQGPRIDTSALGVHQLFAQQMRRAPEAIALVQGQQKLSYQDLDGRAQRLAHHLINRGIGPGMTVAVCLERSIELIVSLLAILKAGAAYLALDPSWPETRKQLLIEQSASSMLLEAHGETLFPINSADRRPPSGSPLAYINYTSGTTGSPKGVAITHAAIARLVHPVNGFRLSAGERILQLAPVAFDAATFEIWGPLLHGGTLVVAPPGHLSLAALAALLRQHEITTLWLTAGLFHAMVEAELQALAGVRQVLAGGDVLSSRHVQRLIAAFPEGHSLINGYGPTENTTFTCCHRIKAAATLDPHSIPIGRPIAGTVVRVLDDNGNECPIGIPGELHIGGLGLAQGYLDNPELTAERFILDPTSSDPSARLYKSGDLVSWHPDGTLAFQGRIDQQIKLRGFRIEPGEIEAQLLAHPHVAQAAVVLRHDDPNNPRLIAYWVADASQPTTAASSGQLRTFLADRLPDSMVPAAFLQLETLPLTPNGKVDRKSLQAPSFSGDLSQRVEPSTTLECQLHALWAEVLGHSDFGISDNFFLIGGHSLAAARLADAIGRTQPRSLSVADIFRLSTIAGQASWLSQSHSQSSDNLVSLQPAGDRLPLYAIHGVGGRIGGFISLARALAPHRPLLGLQASELPGDARQPGLLGAMASSYAEQILAQHPGGPIHLIGFSAGGWYAHAVAAALLQRGARIGMLAMLDTHPAARIHKRIGLPLLAQKLIRSLSKSHRILMNQPQFPNRVSLLGLLRGIKAALYLHLQILIPHPPKMAAALTGQALPPTAMDPYLVLLIEQYRPPQLPITIDVFAPPGNLPALQRLWSFYGLEGVHLHPLFQAHNDFIDPDRMEALAMTLEHVLDQVERGYR